MFVVYIASEHLAHTELQGALDPENSSADPFQDAETDIGPMGTASEGAIVLPTSGVPVPTPDPRRQAFSTDLPEPESGMPENLADETTGEPMPDASPDPSNLLPASPHTCA